MTPPPAYAVFTDGAHWSLSRDGVVVASRTGPPRRTADALRELCDLLADTQADAATYRAELGQCVEAARLMDEWIAATREGMKV